jgi:peptidoglycan/LPS O-acetylase OafA/YrhL
MEERTTFAGQFINNGTLSVDTFFFLSGFLTCFLFLKECGKRKGVDIKTMVMYYVHRYLRLTPPMMIWVMIVATLMTYIAQGRPMAQEWQECQDDWWRQLLYINNFHDNNFHCLGVTWYLAHDMQFYVIAPLIMIPFVYKYYKTGLFLSFGLIAVHIGCHIWLITEYEFDNIRQGPGQLFSDKVYFVPWTRVAPYAIGLIFGLIMHKTDRKPIKNKYVAFFGWVVAIGVCFTATMVTYDENNDMATIGGKSNWPLAGRLIHETFYRPVWALVIGWIVLACESGYGGFINSILSWEGWLPLSRLNFGAYLMHMTIISFESYNKETTSLFTIDILIYKFFGFYVMSNAISYLLAVFVEVPLARLERVFLK